MATSNHIYWTDQGTDKVQRADLDGGGVSDLQTGLNTPKGLDIHIASGHVYWTDPVVGYIRRCDFDGSNMVPIISGVANSFQGVAVDVISGYLYSCRNTAGSKRVERCNLDGSNLTPLVSGALFDPIDIAIHNAVGKLYWTDVTGKYIGTANLDGSASGVFASGLSAPFSTTIDYVNDKLYWTNGSAATVGSGSVQRSDFDGSNIETLVSGLSRPHGLAIDTNNSRMYFSEVILGTINRCDLDGYGITTVISGLTNPQWIAVDSQELASHSGTMNLMLKAEDSAGSGVTYVDRIIHEFNYYPDSSFAVIGEFSSGVNVNIQLWSAGSGVSITSSGCTEVDSTGKYIWLLTNLVTIPNGNTQYQWQMSDGLNVVNGDFILHTIEGEDGGMPSVNDGGSYIV